MIRTKYGHRGPWKTPDCQITQIKGGGGRGPTRSLGALRAPTPTLVCVRPTIRTKNQKLGGGLTDTCRGQTWMVAVLVVGMAVCVRVAFAAFCLGGALAVWPLGGVPRAYPPTCGGLLLASAFGLLRALPLWGCTWGVVGALVAFVGVWVPICSHTLFSLSSLSFSPSLWLSLSSLLALFSLKKKKLAQL